MQQPQQQSQSTQHHSSNSNRQRKNVISCVTVNDSDNEDKRNSPKHQTHVKYEPHVGQSQKKRLLAMAQNECLLTPLHVPKQEPPELQYEYPQVDKRSSWALPTHHNHHKRDSVPYVTSQQAPPPIAHSKNIGAGSWGTPIYRQYQAITPVGVGGSPGVLQQDIYSQPEVMYRRPPVFISQGPYQSYNRVVPPPAHNGSSRQVCCFAVNFHIFKIPKIILRMNYRFCQLIIHYPRIYNSQRNIASLHR